MTRGHGLTAVDGTIALIAILLIVQMWLLTATLEAYLAGHSDLSSQPLSFPASSWPLAWDYSSSSIESIEVCVHGRRGNRNAEQIGPPKDPANVVDLLLECHERIRSFIALAIRLGAAENPSGG